MKKLIIKMPYDKDATLLLTTAFALAHYTDEDDIYRGSHGRYVVDKTCLEPERVLRSASEDENYREGLREYEVDAELVDGVVMGALAELQTLVPFEMYFENRGGGDNDEECYHVDIDDYAIATFYYAEPAVYATADKINQWRERQKKIVQLPANVVARITNVKAARV